MTKPKPIIDPTTTEEYAEGRQAFLDGKPDADNSYPKKAGTNQRTWWFIGWYDARTQSLYDRLNAKYGTLAAAEGE